MSIINLDRDMIWPNVADEPFTPFSSSYTLGSPSIRCDGTVYERTAFVQTDLAVTETVASGFASAVGVCISPPLEDNTPYRVRASMHRGATNPIGLGLFCCWGTLSSTTLTPTTNEIYLGGTYLNDIDLVVCLPPASDDSWTLCFYLENFKTNNYGSHIYVQRLVGKPPQYASSVS